MDLLGLIVDYGHLKGKYNKPHLHLPATIHMLRTRRPHWTGHFMVRLDLKYAFYSVPLLESLKVVSAFRWRSKTYRFHLPMGLFLSPAVFNKILEPASTFAWAHVDDILLVGRTKSLVEAELRRLNSWGFRLAVAKSVLRSVQRLVYCGLELDLRAQMFRLDGLVREKIRQLFAWQDLVKSPDWKGTGWLRMPFTRPD